MEDFIMTFPGVVGKGQIVYTEIILIRLGVLSYAAASRPIRRKNTSAKCVSALVQWGANHFFPRLLNITRGELWPLTPTGRGKGEGDFWRIFFAMFRSILFGCRRKRISRGDISNEDRGTLQEGLAPGAESIEDLFPPSGTAEHSETRPSARFCPIGSSGDKD
jgi:hypothetical protein